MEQFQSGLAFPFREDDFKWTEQTIPRKTRLVFGFRQKGRPVENWNIQKLTIEDATGNRFSPYLVRHSQGFSWTTNGTVKLLGALWPGENAWKLDVEFVRASGFAADELWESPPITLPAVGVDTNLNAGFQRDGATVQLAGLAAPGADHPAPFTWIAKYWGSEEKDKIVSLAVRISPALDRRRLKLLRAMDQNGREARLVEHRNEDDTNQAFLLRPDDEAITLKLIFALQRSRFVQFQVRPQIVSAEAASQRGK